jgi:hypothetical protein
MNTYVKTTALRKIIALLLALCLGLALVPGMKMGVEAAEPKSWSSSTVPVVVNGDTITLSGNPSGTMNVPASAIVTITGTVTAGTTGITFNIGAGATVNWTTAQFSKSATHAVTVSGSGTFIMSGGSIRTTKAAGYGIYKTSTGNVNVSGGTVTATNGSGRGIYNNSSTGKVTVSGTGAVTATGLYGTGIQNYAAGTVEVSGGTIAATGESGYGIANTVGGIVEVSGGTVAVTGTGIANPSGTATVNGTGTVISSGTLTTGSVEFDDDDDAVGFTYVTASTRTKGTSTDIDVAAPATGATAWWDIVDGDSGISWSYGANTGFYEVPGVTVRDVFDITPLSAATTKTVAAGATLYVTGTNGSAATPANFGITFTIGAGATVVWEDAAFIISSTSVQNAVTVASGSTGTFTMSGGSIDNTYLSGRGRGIYNDSGSTVSISGGTVTASGSNGRGLYNNSTGTVSVSGTATVTATGEGGIGIVNYSGGTVTVSGGTISADTHGIYNNDNGDVTVSGTATVTAMGEGGCGIGNYSTGTVIVSGGTITATGEYGYGIVNDSGTVTVSGTAAVVSGGTLTSGTVTFSQNAVGFAYGVTNTPYTQFTSTDITATPSTGAAVVWAVQEGTPDEYGISWSYDSDGASGTATNEGFYEVAGVRVRYPGSTIANIPAESSKSDTAITVSAATLTTATGQTIGYAINQSSTLAPTENWGTSLGFSGLSADTTYYVWAKAQENTDYAAGTPSPSLAITTDIADTSAVSTDKAALTWNTIKGTNTSQSAVNANLSLPTSGANGTTITWASSDTAIATEGTVTRPPYADGDTEVTLTATISKGLESDTKVFIITVTKLSASNDASLTNLTISEGTLDPAFAANTTNYTASVANEVESVTIGGAAANAYASVSGTGEKSLTVGDNTFAITVTAQDGMATKTYTITITRAAAVVDPGDPVQPVAPTVSPAALSLTAGGSGTLHLTLGTSYTGAIISSRDLSVATVSTDSVSAAGDVQVNAIAAGSAVITITFTGGTPAYSVTVPVIVAAAQLPPNEPDPPAPEPLMPPNDDGMGDTQSSDSSSNSSNDETAPSPLKLSTRMRDVDFLSLSDLRTIAALAIQEGKEPWLNVDTLSADKKIVDVRVGINPTLAKKGMNLAGYIDNPRANKTRRLFEKFYSNEFLSVINLSQKGDFGQLATICVRMPPDINVEDLVEDLVMYSYDPETNEYNIITDPHAWIDTKSFLHFKTFIANDIVVSVGALSRRADLAAENDVQSESTLFYMAPTSILSLEITEVMPGEAASLVTSYVEIADENERGRGNSLLVILLLLGALALSAFLWAYIPRKNDEYVPINKKP